MRPSAIFTILVPSVCSAPFTASSHAIINLPQQVLSSGENGTGTGQVELREWDFNAFDAYGEYVTIDDLVGIRYFSNPHRASYGTANDIASVLDGKFLLDTAFSSPALVFAPFVDVSTPEGGKITVNQLGLELANSFMPLKAAEMGIPAFRELAQSEKVYGKATLKEFAPCGDSSRPKAQGGESSDPIDA